jgi:PAS domain-containing protein
VEPATWAVLDVNDAAVRLYGFPREACASCAPDLWTPTRPAPTSLERVDAPADPTRSSATARGPASRCWVRWRCALRRSGANAWVLVSVQDLTARVRAEEAARRSERVYRASSRTPSTA